MAPKLFSTSIPFPLIFRMKKPSPPSNPRLMLCIWLSMRIASAPARNPSFCTMYSFTPSSSKMAISPGTVGASKASPGPRLARNVWKKNFSPVKNFRDRAPRKPPSILLSMSMVGEQATIAPDSALMFSPAANSTRTIGNAPGYNISLLIPIVSFFYNHTPAEESARVALTARVHRAHSDRARCASKERLGYLLLTPLPIHTLDDSAPVPLRDNSFEVGPAHLSTPRAVSHSHRSQKSVQRYGQRSVPLPAVSETDSDACRSVDRESEIAEMLRSAIAGYHTRWNPCPKARDPRRTRR